MASACGHRHESALVTPPSPPSAPALPPLCVSPQNNMPKAAVSKKTEKKEPKAKGEKVREERGGGFTVQSFAGKICQARLPLSGCSPASKTGACTLLPTHTAPRPMSPVYVLSSRTTRMPELRLMHTHIRTSHSSPPRKRTPLTDTRRTHTHTYTHVPKSASFLSLTPPHDPSPTTPLFRSIVGRARSQSLAEGPYSRSARFCAHTENSLSCLSAEEEGP
jgi:hypothetical protein